MLNLLLKTIIVLLICYASVMHVEAADRYQIVDLGTFSNRSSVATDINEYGQICGTVQTGIITTQVFLWDPQTGLQILDIENTKPNPHLNNYGEIAGSFTVKGWFTNTVQGYIWDEKKGTQQLSLPIGWTEAYVRDINDLGEVLMMDKGLKACRCNPKAQVGVFKDEHLASADFSPIPQGDRINNRSQVLGTTFVEINGKELCYPLLFNLPDQTLTKIPFPERAYGMNLNDLGQIVGVMENAKGKRYGFVWDATKGITYFKDFRPSALNNNNVLVGLYGKEDRGFIYENGEYKNLLDISTPRDEEQEWSWLFPLAINDRGYIVGKGTVNGKEHAFLLLPIE